MEQLWGLADSSFKYILIGFNFLTILVIYVHSRRTKKMKQHNILFVTAHPDDECMFFRPTIISLQKEYIIHLLCLSGGNTQREQQLKIAFTCLSNQLFPDSMQKQWPSQPIMKELLTYIRENNVKAVFTFDKNGISDHINHKSIYKALSKLICQKKAQESPQEISIIKFYTLETVNIIRKYSGILDLIVALLKDYAFFSFNFISSWKTMSAHKSQFVWYRKLWLIFSRYTFMNTYQRYFINIKQDQIKQE